MTGQVEFDEFGDTKVKVITGYEVKDGKWATLKTETSAESTHAEHEDTHRVTEPAGAGD